MKKLSYMKFKREIGILMVFIIIGCPSLVLAQTGEDGWTERIINQYMSDSEVARKSIKFVPGFNTAGHTDFRAYIDPELPYNGGATVTNGEFNMNYIRTFTPLKNNATTYIPEHQGLNYNNWSEQISYFDGLGRLSQEIGVKASPFATDLVMPVEYDIFGRQKYEYLPYAIAQSGDNGPGGYRTNGVAEQQAFNDFFFDDEGVYAKQTNLFDDSPLNRIVKTFPPGLAWNTGEGNPVTTVFASNSSSEVLRLTVLPDKSLKAEYYYDAGTLYKTLTRDENGHQTVQFKDLHGRLVSEQSYDGQNWLITQMVYDDIGRLRYVLPPKAASCVSPGNTYSNTVAWILQLCFYYEYNSRNLVKFKRLPGCEPVYLVYNRRDLPVLTQDGNLRGGNKWLFTKYDALNRPVMTGIYNHGSPASIETMQALVDNMANSHENYIGNGNLYGYSNQSFPEVDINDEIHTVTYYDNYDFLLVPPANTRNYSFRGNELEFNYGVSNKTKGLVTGTITKVLEFEGQTVEDDVLVSVNYYDKYGRLIQSVTDNQLGRQDVVSATHEFTGNVLREKENHDSGSENNMLNRTFTYDNGGRLKQTTLKVNDFDEIIMSRNNYNELGRVRNRQLHSEGGSDFIQTTDHQHNIRGWLEAINDADHPGNDYFSMKLGYADGDQPQYNGNISYLKWKSAIFPEMKVYKFGYDETDRLVSAGFTPDQRYNVNIGGTNGQNGYDPNGNILFLQRRGETGNGAFGPIDALTYQYTGNQLIKVDDYDSSPAYQNNGFSDNGAFDNNEYLYDQNGNMISDANKQIMNISYTHQNLPRAITIGGDAEHRVCFLYDATGRKIRKQTLTNQAINATTDYVGSFVYENNVLQYILTAEGRVVLDGPDARYQYFLKDHLGNTRVVFDDAGVITQDNSYYPFGMVMSGLDYDNESYAWLNKYLYNGKEFQDDFGLDWYDYGARFYDPAIGRWHVVDPMAEVSYKWSPFSYCYDNPMKFLDPDGMLAGEYYNQKGEYLGTDNIDDKKVYVADKKNEDGTFLNAKDLGVTHDEFATSSNVVKHESSGDKTESLWIAHAANNAKDNDAIDFLKQNSTLYEQLTDKNYSTTPETARTPLDIKDKSSSANNARAAVISVLSGKADPTGGAVLWDGSDFLKNGDAHNKFKEYSSINITDTHLQTYSNAQKVTISLTFKTAIDSKTAFTGAGTGKYYSLHSTGAHGKSIFWKIVKK